MLDRCTKSAKFCSENSPIDDSNAETRRCGSDIEMEFEKHKE